jgi:hypothetical protein
VWTVIKGKSNTESTLVVTHTDGVNVIEENGPLGVLELARMFAGEGEPPQRTLVFVFVTGHLRIPAVTRHGQATTAWLTAHRQWWAGDNNGPRAVAGLVIEHLGARAADGIPELAYTTNTTMRKVLERWEKANPTKGVTVVARPRLLQIGEGEPLYQHGIPAISLASVPNYLLQTSSENFLDADLLHSQVDTLARALLALDATPASEIGPIKRMTLCKTLATWLRLARFILGDARLRAHVRRVACLKLGSWAMVAVRWLTGGSNPRRAP